jgi:hypothetical protein
MRTSRLLVPLSFGAILLACGSVPNDPGARIFPPSGVIRGTVVYQGPHPCSRNGHIVGNAVVLVFDRRNPPPPNGLAPTAVNFGDVTGDRLFANEARYPGDDMIYCPADHGVTDTITASGPFEIGPVAGGSYELQAFFDYTGDWLPEFKFRNLPELGDIVGGDIDTADALKPGNVGNLNYQPVFLPVEVGIPQPLGSAGNGLPNAIPNYVIPPSGFVADNVTVSIGAPLKTTRPYFWPTGLQYNMGTGQYDTIASSAQPANPVPDALKDALESPMDPEAPYYVPVLTIPQDIKVLAPPIGLSPAAVIKFESSFKHLQLKWGVPSGELSPAVSGSQPFHMQIGDSGGFLVWANGAYDPAKKQYVDQLIPEGNHVPAFWPVVVLSKLVDDYQADSNGRFHTLDPASLTAQGDPKTPVIIMQGITETGASAPPDTLLGAGLPELGSTNVYVDPQTGAPKTPSLQTHLNVVLRPSVICFDTLFDPTNPDKRGTLVTPYLTGDSADMTPVSNIPLVPSDLLTNSDANRQSVKGQVSNVVQGCLPKGRYAINVVYPNGQAWTVPNEAGACSGTEGATDYNGLTCTLKPRPVLLSQGNRAVVEIVGPLDPNNCTGMPNTVPPTPPQCRPQQ